MAAAAGRSEPPRCDVTDLRGWVAGRLPEDESWRTRGQLRSDWSAEV